ncbi:hypothetical protein HDU93_002097, partial [Gonapodya sp. JEL0774]
MTHSRIPVPTKTFLSPAARTAIGVKKLHATDKAMEAIDKALELDIKKERGYVGEDADLQLDLAADGWLESAPSTPDAQTAPPRDRAVTSPNLPESNPSSVEHLLKLIFSPRSWSPAAARTASNELMRVFPLPSTRPETNSVSNELLLRFHEFDVPAGGGTLAIELLNALKELDMKSREIDPSPQIQDLGINEELRPLPKFVDSSSASLNLSSPNAAPEPLEQRANTMTDPLPQASQGLSLLSLPTEGLHPREPQDPPPKFPLPPIPLAPLPTSSSHPPPPSILSTAPIIPRPAPDPRRRGLFDPTPGTLGPDLADEGYRAKREAARRRWAYGNRVEKIAKELLRKQADSRRAVKEARTSRPADGSWSEPVDSPARGSDNDMIGDWTRELASLVYGARDTDVVEEEGEMG